VRRRTAPRQSAKARAAGLHQSKAQKSRPPLHQSKARKLGPPDFTRAKRESLCLPHFTRAKRESLCLPHFTRAKRESRPADFTTAKRKSFHEKKAELFTAPRAATARASYRARKAVSLIVNDAKRTRSVNLLFCAGRAMNGRAGRRKPPAATRQKNRGCLSMKNQTFGIEVEMTGLARSEAARVVATHFGTRAEYLGGAYDAWGVADGEGRCWKLVSDGSIVAPSDQQTEFVSPICRWTDIETVQELVRKLRKAGARPHPSCGIHVHIGRGEHTPRTLRNLVNIVNAKEDLLTQALQISPDRRERWCCQVDQRFLEQLNRRKPKTDAGFAELWYGTRNWRANAQRHYDPSRYRLLNLHSVFQKGTIEFRAFNSTLHAGEVKAFIQLCMAVSHQALESSSASARRPQTDNPKYTFRCWLLRLGFIGDEFETARLHLTKHLPGNAAWRRAS